MKPTHDSQTSRVKQTWWHKAKHSNIATWTWPRELFASSGVPGWSEYSYRGRWDTLGAQRGTVDVRMPYWHLSITSMVCCLPFTSHPYGVLFLHYEKEKRETITCSLSDEIVLLLAEVKFICRFTRQPQRRTQKLSFPQPFNFLQLKHLFLHCVKSEGKRSQANHLIQYLSSISHQH